MRMVVIAGAGLIRAKGVASCAGAAAMSLRCRTRIPSTSSSEKDPKSHPGAQVALDLSNASSLDAGKMNAGDRWL